MSLKFIHVPNGKYRLFFLFSKVVTAGDQKIKPEKNEKCCIEPLSVACFLLLLLFNGDDGLHVRIPKGKGCRFREQDP
jgi:hypothetical protein